MLVRSSIANGHCQPIAGSNNCGMAKDRTKEIREEIQAIRKRRLLEFLSSCDSNKDAAEKLGVEPGFFSQFKLDKKNKGRRPIGEALARRMEEEAHLPRLWFDDIVISDQQLSYRELRLIEYFRRLSDEATKKNYEEILHRLAEGQRGYDPQIDIDTHKLRKLAG